MDSRISFFFVWVRVLMALLGNVGWVFVVIMLDPDHLVIAHLRHTPSCTHLQ